MNYGEQDDQLIEPGTREKERTAVFQVTFLGLIFLGVFTAYLTIQTYANKMYGDELNSNLLSALYGTFCISNLFAPLVTNKLGVRLTLFIGIMGYAALVATGLLYFLVTFSGKDGVTIFGGVLCGLGASLVWNAQGRLILEHATPSNRGTLTGIFFFLFQTSAVVGGIITTVYFSKMKDNQGNSTLYVIFLGCILIGALFIFALKKPTAKISVVEYDIKNEVKNIFSIMFKDHRLALMSPFFFYTGFNQPYQLNMFSRVFDKQALGIGMIIYYTCDMMASMFVGRVLDKVSPFKRRFGYLGIFALLIFVSYGIGLYLENGYRVEEQVKLSVSNPKLILPYICFALFGIMDSLGLVYSTYILGCLFTKGDDISAGVGLFKFVQTLGWFIGFVILPVNRCSAIIQISIIFANGVLGVVLASFVSHTDNEVILDVEEDLDEARLLNDADMDADRKDR